MVLSTAEGVHIQRGAEHMMCVQAMSHALHAVQGCHSAHIEYGGRHVPSIWVAQLQGLVQQAGGKRTHLEWPV